MDPTILIVVIGAVVAGFVQGLSGFAFGLVAMGIWAWALDPVLAGPLVVFGSLIGQLLATGSMWRTLNPWRAIPFVLGGILGVPLGVVLLRFINPLVFKACVGLLLVVWCPIMLFARELPRIEWGGKWADSVVGWIGGIMGGLGGLTGPAPILWATLRGWDRHVQRAVFQVFNLCMHQSDPDDVFCLRDGTATGVAVVRDHGSRHAGAFDRWLPDVSPGQRYFVSSRRAGIADSVGRGVDRDQSRQVDLESVTVRGNDTVAVLHTIQRSAGLPVILGSGPEDDWGERVNAQRGPENQCASDTAPERILARNHLRVSVVQPFFRRRH